MVAIAGGGHNAFSRYERAEVEPPRALWVLLTLLDRNPSLIQQVEQIAAEGAVKFHHLVAEKGKARVEY
ncbi:type II toxin-antitoxin system MqsA family antitoxin [Pseudomonas sp. PDM13]|uniref:type II toxin-antitoxin system MqsA family antitoxin n=1 Tax=Pseudomonas sp. PDM13 TaxID=2769255 RepID=UPI0021DFA727|nr:type II toxin-antitoxin system MqsA family antitoxin [Pseudomonas sp. PDM13]MCU9949685.1 type II toxin-antitoxin system MqsA family antitoxin [Pseudomonas sp. PDM13]